LLSAVVALSPAALPLAAQAPPKPLTVEAIYAHGPLAGQLPEGISWSPDGKHLTYLDGGELIDLDPALDSGAKPEQHQPHVLVSRAKLASISGPGGSETDRDHRSRYGMATYLWAPDSSHLLFDSNGRLWLFDLHNGTGVEVGFTGAAAGDDPTATTSTLCATTAFPSCGSRSP
jgi:dipeptidyl-peptidase-4